MNSRYFGSSRESTNSGDGENSTASFGRSDAACVAVSRAAPRYRPATIGTSLRVSRTLRHHRDELRRDRARSREIVAGSTKSSVTRCATSRAASIFDGALNGQRRMIRHAHAAHGVARFDADRVVRDVALCSRANSSAARDHVGVERAGEALVGGHQDHARPARPPCPAS